MHLIFSNVFKGRQRRYVYLDLNAKEELYEKELECARPNIPERSHRLKLPECSILRKQ